VAVVHNPPRGIQWSHRLNDLLDSRYSPAQIALFVTFVVSPLLHMTEGR
jgi:hypothetical protein